MSPPPATPSLATPPISAAPAAADRRCRPKTPKTPKARRTLKTPETPAIATPAIATPAMAAPAVSSGQLPAQFLERMSSMLENEACSDVSLLVGPQPRLELVSRKGIYSWFPAHKFVLSLASPVFRQLFDEDKTDSVIVPDTEPEALRTLLRCFYRHEVVLDESLLVDTLKLAQRFEVPAVIDAVVDRLLDGLSAQNVFELHEQTGRYGEERLAKRIDQFICAHAEQLLRDEPFERIRKPTLKYVLQLLRRQAAATLLFDACLRWARAYCEREHRPNASRKFQRSALGELLYLVPVPTLTLEQFAIGPARSGLFSQKERLQIIDYILLKEHTEDSIVVRFRLD